MNCHRPNRFSMNTRFEPWHVIQTNTSTAQEQNPFFSVVKVADFQKLQEAKEVLCDENKRKNYDLWKRSGVMIPFHDWQALNDSVKTSMHWAVRNKKEPMLEASKPEDPITSQAESFHCEQQETGKSSCESTTYSGDFCHRRFRWAGDSPSNLLRKFRNYEI
uniref:J domain-containing protein n=1 Tax=Oreochromis aureus TaxID=47969 RepID=A0A668SE43_OREAU